MKTTRFEERHADRFDAAMECVSRVAVLHGCVELIVQTEGSADQV